MDIRDTTRFCTHQWDDLGRCTLCGFSPMSTTTDQLVVEAKPRPLSELARLIEFERELKVKLEKLDEQHREMQMLYSKTVGELRSKLCSTYELLERPMDMAETARRRA